MHPKVPKVAKGDRVIFVAHTIGTLHGNRHRVEAKVLDVRGDGKIDLIVEELPGHLTHVGTAGPLKYRGTEIEPTGSHRLLITSSPFDPTGEGPDSWHVGTQPAAAPASDADKK